MLVVGSASDPLVERLGCSLGEIGSQCNWAPASSFLNNSEFSLTWRLARNMLAFNDWAFKECLKDTPDFPCCGSGLEETAWHAFYNCKRVHPFWDHVREWTARISPKPLVLLDVGYVMDNDDRPYQSGVSVARMVIWETRNKGL